METLAIGAGNKTCRWHRWHIALIVVALCAGCGSSTTPGSAGSGGGAGAVALSPCPACTPDSYTCSTPGVESATMEITSRTDSGCSGQIQSSGFELTCNTSTICYAGSCTPFTVEGGALHFSPSGGNVTCAQ